MTDEQENPLQILVGRKLISVEFIEDDVQLRFNGPCLTAITLPVLHKGNQALKFGLQGYRDVLCEHISQVVNSATYKEGEEISLRFSDESSISISLRPVDYVGPEAANFNDGSENLWVWYTSRTRKGVSRPHVQ